MSPDAKRHMQTARRHVDPRQLSVVSVWVLLGLLWCIAVYGNLPNMIRVPVVILMVAVAFAAGQGSAHRK